MIHLLRIIANVGQAIIPLFNYELLGFAAFILAMIHNASISFDQGTPKN